MTKSRRSTVRSAATQGLYLTQSEARAEAAYMVLELVLSRLPASERNRLAARAIIEAEKVGVRQIEEETHALFDTVLSEAPVR